MDRCRRDVGREVGDAGLRDFTQQHHRRAAGYDRGKFLVGEEPAIAPVLELLLRRQEDFSAHFGQDLARFRERFAAGDARSSAFWRAVRQEALSTSDVATGRSEHEPRLLAFFGDYDEPELYMGCSAETELPTGVVRTALASPVGPVTHYLGLGTGEGAMTEAVRGYFTGRCGRWSGQRFLGRGVVVFQQEIANEYRAVGGSEADGCDLALVRSERLGAFTEAFRGHCVPSKLPTWTFVVGCRVVVRGRPPEGLEDVTHLHETMWPPTVRFVGGIQASGGYLANPDYLPRVRFPDATGVRLLGAKSTVHHASKDEGDSTLWVVPKTIASEKPQVWSARVDWEDTQGNARMSETSLEFVATPLRYDYKSPAGGRFWMEGARSADVERVGVEGGAAELADGTVAVLGGESDFLWSQRDRRYLGLGLGEISDEPGAGAEWLSLGPPNAPSALAYIGDTTSPTLPSGLCADDGGARRRWRKALNVGRVGVLEAGRSYPVNAFPEVARALRTYRRVANTKVGCLGSLPHATLEGTLEELQNVPSHQATSAVADAVAARSVRSAGLARKEFLQTLALAFGPDMIGNSRLLHGVARSWAEAGLVDVVIGQGRSRHLVIARRPRIVAFRVGSVVRAALVGLLPRSLADRAAGAASSLGILLKQSGTLSPWTPPPPKLEAESMQDLRELSRLLDLREPLWLQVPSKTGFPIGLDPWQAELREGEPPRFELRGSWSFAAGSMGPPAPNVRSGVRLDLRGPIYVIGLDGKDEFWTFSRTWAILLAYVLHDERFRLPFTVRRRLDLISLHPGIHLPLAAARYINILSPLFSGPVPARGDRGAGSEYCYPLAALVLEKLFPESRFYHAESAEPNEVGGEPCKTPSAAF